MPVDKHLKVGVFFWGCNNLDKRAFQYLLLSLNKNQTLFEFEIHDHKIFNKGPKGKKLLNLDLDEKSNLKRQLDARLLEYGNIVADIIKDPENELPLSSFKMPDYKIIIIEKIVKNEFYTNFDGEQTLGIIAIRAWRKKYAPPSVLEFLLSSVIGTTIDLIGASCKVDANWNPHIATRGCIQDFNYEVENARNSVLINHICSSCREKAESIFGKDSYSELKEILSKDWLGNPSEFGTIAYNLKRYFSYDLLKTKGLRASRLEILTQKFSEAFVENMARAILAIFIIFLMGLAGFFTWKEIIPIITN
jgi:hypothetical protein